MAAFGAYGSPAGASFALRGRASCAGDFDKAACAGDLAWRQQPAATGQPPLERPRRPGCSVGSTTTAGRSREASIGPLLRLILAAILATLTALPLLVWRLSDLPRRSAVVPPSVDDGGAPAVRVVDRDALGVDVRSSPEYPQAPALRGCCGAPAEFRWFFLDGLSGAVAGQLFRTRLLGVDAWGRRASAAACAALPASLEFAATAAARKPRLAASTSWPPKWRASELPLDFESEASGVFEAELRLAASPEPGADVLLETSQIRFAPGEVSRVAIHLRRGGTGDADGDLSDAEVQTSWHTGQLVDVVVTLHDKLGNAVPVDSVPLLRLRCDVAMTMVPEDGRLSPDARGRGRLQFTPLRAGPAKLRLEAGGAGAVAPQIGAATLSVDFRGGAVAAESSAPSSAATAASASAAGRWGAVAAEVKQEFLHAWNSYKRHAWGFDELQPVSKKGRNSFGGIGITILDSLTTLWLMGLRDEFDVAVEFVEKCLDFGKAVDFVSTFELIIRALGGLLGAYALSGRRVLLEKARDLGERLLPALNTTSRLPYPKWSLGKLEGQSTGEPTILAEAGSLQLEFRYLARQTGDQRFLDASDATFEAIRSTGLTGLMPVYLTPPEHPNVRSLVSKFAIGALADSYYEYLLKLWLQSPAEERFRKMWLDVVDELPKLTIPHTAAAKKHHRDGKPIRLTEVQASGERIWKMDHLSCFAPAMLVLGAQTLPKAELISEGRNATLWNLAEGIAESCRDMWTSSESGLSPEFVPLKSNPPYGFGPVPNGGRHSFLRPETFESFFYLHRRTGNEKYRQWGEKIFRSIVANARLNDGGYASVEDVMQVPTVKLDEMQSFVMAETFKYLYLLFAPADALDLDLWVLNTEGHPLPRG